MLEREITQSYFPLKQDDPANGHPATTIMLAIAKFTCRILLEELNAGERINVSISTPFEANPKIPVKNISIYD